METITSTTPTTHTYIVWGEGKQRTWEKYSGTDRTKAVKAFHKAVESGKWGEVYIEVDTAVTRYSPTTLTEAGY